MSAAAIANAESSMHGEMRAHNGKACNSANGCVQGTNSASGPGVLGNNVGTGFGVLGESQTGNAAVGGFNTSTAQGASGIYGQSLNGPGINGVSTSSFSIWAQGTTGTSNLPLYLSRPSSSGNLLWYGEGNGGGFAYLDDLGDMTLTGEIFTGGACSDGCSRTRHEESFAGRTSQPTLDDVGEATLHGGEAYVPLDGSFANAIDLKKPYVVLLTPEGDAGLYVAGRTRAGFDVREIGGGHANLSFAYRIVAKPYGVRDERLPFRTTISPRLRLRQ